MTGAEGSGEDAVSSRRDRVRAMLASSTFVATGSSVGDAVGRFARGSWLYRWLTAEPEPDVIVIDLRETRTLGPFITLLDRVIAWLAPYWRQSGLKRAVDGGVAMLDRAADTRAGRLAARVLAPPAPPETRDSAEDASNDDRKQSAPQE